MVTKNAEFTDVLYIFEKIEFSYFYIYEKFHLHV